MSEPNANTIQLYQAPDVDTTALAPAPRTVGTLIRRTIFDLNTDELDRIQLMARMYAASSFNGSKKPQQEGDFFLMMMKGLELGIAPMAAIDTINIISGKPTLDAKGMLALVKSSGLLQSIDIDSTNERCIVNIQRKNEPEQIISFTIQEAQQYKTTEYVGGQKTTISLSEKANWKSQPGIMLKWRAVTKAMREVFPDILAGLYTQEELAPDITLVQPDGSMEISHDTKVFAGLENPTLDEEAIEKVISWAKPKYGFDSAQQILEFIGQDNWEFSKGNGKTACEYISNAHWNKIGNPVAEIAINRGLIEKHADILSLLGEETWAFAKLDKQIALDHLEAVAKEPINKTSEPATPTWTASDKDELASYLKKHYEKSLDDVFKEIPDTEFSHDLIVFSNAGEAINKINQVATKHNWQISTKIFRVIAKGKGGLVEIDSPIGTLSIFSRTKFSDMLGQDYQDANELDIPNLEPGTYESGYMMVEWKQSGKTNTITNATPYDPYDNIPI